MAFSGYLNGNDKAGKVEMVRDLVIECEGGEDGGEGGEAQGQGEGGGWKEENVVRVVAGTMFVLEGENEEAVATLTEGSAKTDLEW